MNPVEVFYGDGPIVLGMPHTGTHLPEAIFERLNPLGKSLGDTDWHIDRLYEDLLPGATTVRATFHRYVIDANRDPSGVTLYPGLNTTGLVPMTDFGGEPIWEEPPEEAEIEERRHAYHAPYHEALLDELRRVRDQHGYAILYDCHSIRSRIPFLFDGILPDFNIGTNGGTSCDPMIERVVTEHCQSADSYSTVVNGRFKGGWTTRYYGRPDEGVHTIQMELAQATHLTAERQPFHYDQAKAERLRAVLRGLLEHLEEIQPAKGSPS